MFGTLAIYYDSLKGYFSTVFLFLVIRGQLICIWKVFFDTQHKEATKEGHKVEPFFKYKILLKVVSPKYY